MLSAAESNESRNARDLGFPETEKKEDLYYCMEISYLILDEGYATDNTEKVRNML